MTLDAIQTLMSPALSTRRFCQFPLSGLDGGQVFTEIQGRGFDAHTAMSPSGLEDLISSIGSGGLLMPVLLEQLGVSGHGMFHHRLRANSPWSGELDGPDHPIRISFAMAGDDQTPSPQDPAGEARDRFEDAFERLQARSKRSAELNREGADFDTLTADHAELEMMRREAWRAKKEVVSRYEGATPDYVEVPVGMQDTTNFGRVAAIFGAVLLAAAVPLLWFGLLRGGTDLAIAVEGQRIVEQATDDGRTRCILEVDVTVNNESDDLWAFERATAVIDRSRTNLSILTASRRTFAPDFAGSLTLMAVVAPVTNDPCPTLDDIDRNTLSVDFTRLAAEFGEIRRTANL